MTTLPGSLVHRILRRCCNPEAFSFVVEPTLSDLQAEYEQARTRGVWLSRWIWLRSHCALLTVLLWPRCWRPAVGSGSAHFASLVASTAAAAVTLTSLAAIVPVVAAGRHQDVTILFLQARFIQALPVFLPIGLFLALAGSRHHAPQRPGTSALVMGGASLLATSISLLSLGWIGPETYRSLNTLMEHSPGHVRAQELTLFELRSLLHGGQAGVSVELEYFSRWALAFAPAAFALLSVPISRSLNAFRADLTAGLVAVVASVGYAGLAVISRTLTLGGELPASVGAWSPNALLALVALYLIDRHAPHRRRRVFPAFRSPHHRRG